MNALPLRLGTVGGPGTRVLRSGIRWLRDDGHACRANEVVAWCNLSVATSTPSGVLQWAFDAESQDLQVGLATSVGGRLQRGVDASQGGSLDRLPQRDAWRPEQVIGHVHPALGQPEGPVPSDGNALRLLFLAGRRVVDVAEDRSGVLTGWHDRVRGWWGDGDAPPATLLGLGICEQAGLFRGDALAFHEWFAAVPGPAHLVHVPDHVLAPCAPFLLEQLRRTAADAQAIRADFARALGEVAPTPADWMLASSLIATLLRSPLAERCEVVGRRALAMTRGPDAVVLSLNAEAPSLLRHKSLGYVLPCHPYRIDRAGAAVQTWLRRAFEPARRTVAEVRRDYDALFPAMREIGIGTILVINTMSTSGHEDVVSYAAFDRPLAATLGSVRAKEMNLMLHDAAREHDLAIVDNDAMAAALGGGAHLPDGVHNSGAMLGALRADILRILRERGFPGFAPAHA
ncbi:MAG: hypothetical protein ABI585_13600 [Betaproteobacteria bacterium]